jgi:hypothetical protein
MEQVQLALQGEGSTVDGLGDCEHPVEMIQFVLQKLGRTSFEKTPLLPLVFIAKRHG